MNKSEEMCRSLISFLKEELNKGTKNDRGAMFLGS